MRIPIVFFGTPDFAKESLSRLLKHPKIEIKGVVSSPNRQSGRGLKIKQSDVVAFAIDNNLPLSQPESLKDPHFLSTLKNWDAKFFVVVAFRKLPKEVWASPEICTFNIHASLLPEYRGAAPIQWALANGEVETGVTSFIINDIIDSGEILLQKRVPIGKNDTLTTLYDRLKYSGAILSVDTILSLSEKNIAEKVQILSKNEKKAPKIFPDFGYLELLENVSSIHNRIRSCDAYPGASIPMLNGEKGRIKLFSSIILNNYIEASYDSLIKLIISDKNIVIAQDKIALEIGVVQWPGKRRLATSEFVKGFRERGIFLMNGEKIA
ncbi:MAG: Methionyl-tRNA formyltransferase [Owenweeksia sp. TMED14]|nr:MAG: Methionyl-tRNA formyltransferase [Owenweeksia sp. TMED14]